MSLVAAIFVLIILTLFLLNDVRTRSESFWAFFIVFQHIPLIIFNQFGNEQMGLVYFITMGALFYIRTPKLIVAKSRLLNPISVSIFIILASLLFHFFVTGIDSDNIRGQETFNRVFIFNLPIILLCLFGISANSKSMSKFMDGVLVYGVFFIIAVLFVSGLAELGIQERGDFRDEFRISPLVAAKSAGIIIIAAAFKIFYDERFVIRLLSLMIMIFSFAMMFITASRAALIFLLLVMAIFYNLSRDGLVKKVIIITFSSIFFGVSYLIVSQLNLELVQRLEELRDLEQSLRFVRLELIVDMVKNFEMGIWGLGPYGFGHLTGLNYPHNYIAELVVDYGVPGIISVTLFVVFGLFYSYKLINDEHSKEQAFLGVLFIYLFLTSLTSGDIVEARHMQFVAILLANYVVYIKKSNR